MAIRLFVGNLPYNVTEAELREHFSTVGQVSYISIPTDRETGKQRGFAFIEFKDRAQADEAIRRFNNQAFKGRPLSVNEARAKDDRSQAGASSRPPLSRPAPAAARPAPTAESDMALPPGNKPSRNFGPDAAPQRSRNKAKGGAKGGLKPERAPKGPMREIVRGQFFYESDDDDDLDDYDDLETGEEDVTDHDGDPDNNKT